MKNIMNNFKISKISKPNFKYNKKTPLKIIFIIFT